MQNFLGTATDSLNEVFGLVMGRVQKTGGRYIAADGTSSIKSLSGKVLGQVGAIYDPLLERYIGSRVVVEILEGNEIHEHVGIFKNYSEDFIEVLDVRCPQRQMVAVMAGGKFEGQGLVVVREPELVRLTNLNEWPVLVHSLSCGDQEQLINAVVDGGERIDLNVSSTADDAKLNLRVAQELDILVPRSHCVVRHRAEHYRPEELTDIIVDIVFDVGKRFSRNNGDGRDNREARLRQTLREDPKNGLAAANLGFLLIQKDELAEAEKWLRRALEVQYSLPDGGRRARMQLREIQRRREGQDAYVPEQVQAAPVAKADEGWDL